MSTGIKSTAYPFGDETAPGVSPGIPAGGLRPAQEIRDLVDVCPTGVFGEADHSLVVNGRRCIHCFRCVRGPATPAGWSEGWEWATAGGPLPAFDRPFARSLHILVVDAGDCGACLNEVRQLSGPYYNLHRLGFFITPTPREADVLLVVGPVTDHMREPLQKAWDAMPRPKRVLAVGACALSGSVFGPSFICGTGVRDLLPVDAEVPGQPPPPLAILHGLLVIAGRKQSVSHG
ncbi:MAG TPA: NADH:ubiquinone oxidoreductase [Thermoanaerobaculia bacterium]|nr:NADH:ubiquinone oxidoreductase [Thermoanaerobaculia bacterium]